MRQWRKWHRRVGEQLSSFWVAWRFGEVRSTNVPEKVRLLTGSGIAMPCSLRLGRKRLPGYERQFANQLSGRVYALA